MDNSSNNPFPQTQNPQAGNDPNLSVPSAWQGPTQSAPTPPAAPADVSTFVPPIWPQPTTDPIPSQPQSVPQTAPQDIPVPQTPVSPFANNFPPQPTPSPWSPPAEPVPTPQQPEQATPAPVSSAWPAAPSDSASLPQQNPFAAASPSSWQNPTQTEPAPVMPEQPAPIPVSPPFGAPTIPSSPDQPTQYTDPNTLAASNLQTSSPLDNPYSAPSQAPSIDGGLQSASMQSTPAWVPPQNVPQANPEPQETSEQAPTDLSHLIGSDANNQTMTAQSENIVLPQNSVPEVPTIPVENKSGFPKWIIGLGVGLLIIVAGASAYFIMGIGQTPKNTSLPAQEAPANTQQSTPLPTATPASQEGTPATGSANFGQLQGSTPQATSTAIPNSFDQLKARNQTQGR